MHRVCTGNAESSSQFSVSIGCTRSFFARRRYLHPPVELLEGVLALEAVTLLAIADLAL